MTHGIATAKRRLASRPKSYMERSTLIAEDKDWAFGCAKEIAEDKALRTQGQRSLAMTRKLLERGLVCLHKAGGPIPEAVRAKIADVISVSKDELSMALSLLRKVDAGILPRESIESIESGRYVSCRVLCRQMRDRRHPFVEVTKSNEWLLDQGSSVVLDLALRTPTQRSIAYLERMVANHVMDPTVTISRRIAVVTEAARVTLGVSMNEFNACWVVMRSVTAKKLPASFLEDLKLGAKTADYLLKSGLNTTIKKAAASKIAASKTAAPIPEPKTASVCTVRQRSAEEQTEPQVAATADELQELVSAFGTELDSIVARAGQDKELTAIAGLVREQIGLTKLRVVKLLTRRSAERENRRRIK
jgi:hypothetical protein